MTFRDMTFCHSDCGNTACWRHFGDDDREAARKWWGGDDYLVAWANFSTNCTEYQPPTKDP